MAPEPSRGTGRLEGLSRLLTVVVTNATKIVGLVVGLKAAPSGNAYTMGFAAFLIMGGQLSEGTLLGIIERFFSVPQSKPPGRR